MWKGILYTFLGVVITSFGNHLVEKSHHVKKNEKFLLFYGGNFFITVLGTLCSLIGFANAPLIICANIGCLTIVFNALIGTLAYFGSHKLGHSDFVAILCTLFGCMLVVSAKPLLGLLSFSSSGSLRADDSGEATELQEPAYFSSKFMFFLVCIIVLSIYLLRLIDSKRMSERKLIASGCLPGLLGGLSTVFAKGAVDGLSKKLTIELFLFLGLAASAAATQLIFLNRALERYQAIKVIPIYQITLLVSASMSGGLAFQEFKEYTILTWIVYCIGVTFSVCGVFLLSASQANQQDSSSVSSSSSSSNVTSTNKLDANRVILPGKVLIYENF